MRLLLQVGGGGHARCALIAHARTHRHEQMSMFLSPVLLIQHKQPAADQRAHGDAQSEDHSRLRAFRKVGRACRSAIMNFSCLRLLCAVRVCVPAVMHRQKRVCASLHERTRPAGHEISKSARRVRQSGRSEAGRAWITADPRIHRGLASGSAAPRLDGYCAGFLTRFRISASTSG